MKKPMHFGMLFLPIVLILQTIGISTVSAYDAMEGISSAPVSYNITWAFVAYASPDFRAEIKGSFSAQSVNAVKTNDDGWALIETYSGNWWVYLRENMRFLHQNTAIYENRGERPVAFLAPQTVRILAQEGNWLQVSTWLGPRWLYWHTAEHQPGRHHISWKFITYLEPDFRAKRQEVLLSQTVDVVQMRDDGWALIKTPRGDRWVYWRENMRYVENTVSLYDSVGGTPIGKIGPEVVSITAQDGDWFQISTEVGPGWIHFPQVQPSAGKRIALTFDDGPSTYTKRLLDALASRNVSATFFVLGQRVTANPEIAKRIVEEGHEIASHSYSHPNFVNMNAARIRSELSRTNDAIYQATGTRPVLLRTPYGSYNSTVRSVAAEFGFPLIMWSVDTRDWQSRNVSAILSHFVDGNNVRIKDGDIILLHDIYSTTIDATIRAIDLLLAEGFTFVTVSELLGERYGIPTPGNVYSR
ncbi:MAG: polysaccharide deacetylase family protein [Oscillospiraceae bacterium]|nr:polysaccharide deacetylase family protein [Oscillospiraceae bacterium]